MRRAPNARVSAWAATQERFDLSVISVEEVCYGLGLQKSARLERWFNDFVETYCEVLPVTLRIVRRCANLRAELARKGKPRTQADMLIAATAAEHGLTLVTRNERDFVDCGLHVQNPFR